MQRWFQAADEGDTAHILQNLHLMHHSVDGTGGTALIRAAFAGNIDTVAALKPEIGARNNSGRSALM